MEVRGVAGGVTVIVLAISAACGYAISQLDFTGRKLLWFVILASFMIPIQALIVSDEDDPFVPPEIFRTPALTGNHQVRTFITAHGGHCGFVAEANGYDGYWAEQTVINFVAERM